MDIQSMIVLCSVPFVAVLAASRASGCGINPARSIHQLVLALLVAIPIALYALVVGQVPLRIPGPLPGAAVISAVLVGALLATLAITPRLGLGPLLWVDIAVPAVLVGTAAITLGGAAARGLSPALVLATTWQIGMIWALLRTERMLRGWLRPGDILLLSGALAAPGALLAIVLHVDGPCQVSGLAGCQEVLGGAPLLLIAVGTACASILALRHSLRTAEVAAQR